MNKNLLRSKMVAHGDTGGDLAKALGISRVTISMKINNTNGADFTQGEIKKIIDRYNLSMDEVEAIFFGRIVS